MLIGGESVHVRLPPGVMRKVEGQAAKDGMTVSEWIRRCIVTSVISKDLPIQPQVNRTMQPFYAIMGEVFRRALEEDPQLLQRMQTGLDRAIKDQLQELANQGVIPTKESKRKKEAQY